MKINYLSWGLVYFPSLLGVSGLFLVQERKRPPDDQGHFPYRMYADLWDFRFYLLNLTNPKESNLPN